jgi:putative DNA primase/helicase
MTTQTIGTDALRYLEALWRPGEVREVRIPRHNRFGHTASGYFSSPAAAAEAVAAWDGRANVYVTLNPVDPALRARVAERIVPKAEHTSADADVLGRRWLLVDVDPVRPAGVSSSDVELAAAEQVVKAAIGFLNRHGWTEPIVAMSGNGYHALYRVDLPNDAESLALVQAVLAAVSQQADTAAAKVDPTVANASRITALIGTLKMKGDSLPERPHRRSRLERVPDPLLTVPRSCLVTVAGLASSAGDNGRAHGGANIPRRLADRLTSAGLAVRVQPPDSAGIVWYHVERCPFHDDGKPFECGVGEAPDGRFTGKCFHPEGIGKQWRDWKAALGLGTASRPGHDDQGTPTGDPSAAGAFFNRTDAGNGEHFARLYGDKIRFDHRRRTWLVWGGDWWRADDQGAVRLFAKDAARDRFQGAVVIGEAKFAIGSENRQRLDAMLRAAESEPPISDVGDQWDSDAWLLGVANGVIDLRTGALRRGTPGDRVTRHTDVAFDPDARCPRWEQFLDEIFDGDDELVDYIWRAAGYSLSGAVYEQCVFMCHGSGANGKSVFLAILRDASGQYAFNAPFSTFEAKDRSSIPNDLAALAGRRLVTASETNEGTRLNEARLKALTGGDPITARFLHGEFFTYQPVAKLWLAVNHRPEVRDDSYGFWRRVRLVPFGRQFRENADPWLIDTLRAELPGILAWAVRGAIAWQQHGLEPPAAVSSATEAYRAESDPLADFLAECCVEGPGLSVVASEIYRAYKGWAEAQGLPRSETLSNKVFGMRLAARFQKRSAKDHNVYLGVGLRAAGTDRQAA